MGEVLDAMHEAANSAGSLDLQVHIETPAGRTACSSLRGACAAAGGPPGAVTGLSDTPRAAPPRGRARSSS